MCILPFIHLFNVRTSFIDGADERHKKQEER